MSRSPYPELQNLSDAAIADMSEMDRLVDATYRATERYNNLDIDSFEASGGVVTCIGSRILATEYKFMRDGLTVEEDELVRTLSYAPMVAEAHFVGIWSRTETPTAALYTVEAPFRVDDQSSSTHFGQAAVEVIGATKHTKYRSIHEEDGVTVFACDNDQLRPIVIGTEGTNLQTRRNGGRDTLSDPPAVGLHSTISGPAAIRLPGEHYFQVVHPGAVLATSNDVTNHDVYFRPGQGYGVDLRVNAGAKPELGSEGQIVITGEAARDKFKHNPRIDAETAYDLLAGGLNLMDITPEFVSRHRDRPEKLLLLNETLFANVTQTARQAVSTYMAENTIRERALGIAPVTARIASLLADFEDMGPSNRLVSSGTIADSNRVEKI